MSEILLIDAEQPFANNVASALRSRGFTVKHLDDGKDGLDYARDNRPALIVLCVELPKMSGYSICNKLKKDNELKGIPLIITSIEATPETFAQHKKLKTRAEDYLIKPFSDADLLEKIAGLGVIAASGAAHSSPPPSADAFEGVNMESVALDSPATMIAEPPPESMIDVVNSLSHVDDGLSDPLDDSLSGLELSAAPAPSPLAVSSTAESLGLSPEDEAVLAGLSDYDASPAPPIGSEPFDSFDMGGDMGGDLAALDGLPSDDLDAAGSVHDDALDGFDQAFEALAPIAAPPPPAEVAPPVVEAAPPAPSSSSYASQLPQSASLLPQPSSSLSGLPMAADGTTSARTEQAMAQLRRENSELKAKVAELDARLRAADEQMKAQLAQAQAAQPSSSAARELLGLKEQLRAKEGELLKLKDEALEKEKAHLDVAEELERTTQALSNKTATDSAKDVEIASLTARVAAVSNERDELETQMHARLEQGDRDQAQLAQVGAELAASRGQEAQLRADLERTSSELSSHKSTSDALTAELQSKLTAAEGESRGHEERYLAAYARLRSEEAVREKARQAIEIAAALLAGEVDVGHEQSNAA